VRYEIVLLFKKNRTLNCTRAWWAGTSPRPKAIQRLEEAGVRPTMLPALAALPAKASPDKRH